MRIIGVQQPPGLDAETMLARLSPALRAEMMHYRPGAKNCAPANKRHAKALYDRWLLLRWAAQPRPHLYRLSPIGVAVWELLEAAQKK